MQQSKLESHLEAFANLASGFILSFLVWRFVVGPLIEAGYIHPATTTGSFEIVFIFTVISYIRSYFWRRFFNAGIHRAAHQLAVRLLK